MKTLYTITFGFLTAYVFYIGISIASLLIGLIFKGFFGTLLTSGLLFFLIYLGYEDVIPVRLLYNLGWGHVYQKWTELKIDAIEWIDHLL